MMNLAAALNAARSSIVAKSLQTAVTAENISNVDNPNYTRRDSETVSTPGGIFSVSVTRNDNSALLRQFLAITSTKTEQQAVLNGLSELERIVGDTELKSSAAALLSNFQGVLQSFAVLPHDPVVAGEAVQSAVDLVHGINQASDLTQQTRRNADMEIGRSVEQINDLLEQFHVANLAVIQGSGSPSELAGYLDTRDSVLARLSEEMDITTIVRQSNDVAIYAKGGTVLYEKKPRTVSFQLTPALAPGLRGNPVYVDGVPVTGDVLTMGISSGRLTGLVELRDNIAPRIQSQLDEVARGLIEAFAESDQSMPGTLPDAPGIFTYSGAPAIPATGVIVPGLASAIQVNPNADPTQGGNANLLRDGGLSGPSYVYNASGAAGFSDRLAELFDGLSKPRAFDGAAGLETSTSVMSFASSSTSWFEGLRGRAIDENDYQTALLARSSDALSRATGVDLDTELALMMELERSYQASAKLLTTVDTMFSTLLNTFR